MIDPSAEMVTKAEARFAKAGVTVRVRQLEPGSVRAAFAEEVFDVAISHGVLMYCVEHPEEHVQTLAALAGPKGTVSLLTKGFGGALSRVVHNHQSEAMADLLQSGQCINNLGLRVWAFKPDQVAAMLGTCALELVDWRGVRVSSEYDDRPLSPLPKEELEQILAVESLFGENQDTRGLGQMLHYVARKQ